MSKKVTVFNKGSRSFSLSDGVLKPHTAIELDAALAEKLLKKYPKELSEGGAPSAFSESKIQKKLDEAHKEIAEHKEKILELEKALEEATKPVDPKAKTKE